jgi:hypothetical protein
MTAAVLLARSGAIDPGQIGAERPRLESAQFVRKLSHARIRTTDFEDTHPVTGHQ